MISPLKYCTIWEVALHSSPGWVHFIWRKHPAPFMQPCSIQTRTMKYEGVWVGRPAAMVCDSPTPLCAGRWFSLSCMMMVFGGPFWKTWSEMMARREAQHISWCLIHVIMSLRPKLLSYREEAAYAPAWNMILCPTIQTNFLELSGTKTRTYEVYKSQCRLYRCFVCWGAPVANGPDPVQGEPHFGGNCGCPNWKWVHTKFTQGEALQSNAYLHIVGKSKIRQEWPINM